MSLGLVVNCKHNKKNIPVLTKWRNVSFAIFPGNASLIPQYLYNSKCITETM